MAIDMKGTSVGHSHTGGGFSNISYEITYYHVILNISSYSSTLLFKLPSSGDSLRPSWLMVDTLAFEETIDSSLSELQLLLPELEVEPFGLGVDWKGDVSMLGVWLEDSLVASS